MKSANIEIGGLNKVFTELTMTFKDRLQKFMYNKNLSANGLAVKLGYDNGSRITRVLKGNGNPGLDFLEKISNLYPELSMDWLIGG